MSNGNRRGSAAHAGTKSRAGRVASVVMLVASLAGSGAVRADIPTGDITVRLETVASGLVSPAHLTHAGDGSGRLFVVDQAGTIRVIKNGALLPTPFLDLTAQIPVLNAGFDERGVLGLAFHPNYESNGRFFVRYSRPRTGVSGEPCFGTSRGCHEEVLAEFSVSGNPDVANPAGTILFAVDEPEFNHNSGTVEFGPDGYLYFTLGDGGGANDGLNNPNLPHGPIGNGQNIEVPLGKMLRIDVNGAPPYAIPGDNPFVGTTGLDEVYAYGLRNPFRFSFDDGPGGDNRLLVADVGQALYEELNVMIKGGNYGWVLREGAHCFDPFNPSTPPASCNSNGLIDPIAEYTHADGGISIIGGYVYRGGAMPGLAGTYMCGDFSADFGPTGRVYYLDESNPAAAVFRRVRLGADDQPLGRFLKGMGEDEDGEVYVLVSSALGPTGTSGEVLRIAPLYGDCDGDGDVDIADHVNFVACLEGPDVPVQAPPQIVDVMLTGALTFSPADVTINVGDTVHWFWSGTRHNVESGVGGLHDGIFRSGNQAVNGNFSVVFDEAFLAAHPMPGNVYPYFCVVHEFFGMTGTVAVNSQICPKFDADGDGDVDLQDFWVFQHTFTGS